MKSTALLAAVACAAALLAGPAEALGQDPVGNVNRLEGRATAVGADGAERALELGAPIRLNDRVRTQAGAKLMIRFDDGSTVAQGESAELVIDEYVFNPSVPADNASGLTLLKGAFRVVTDQITRLNPDRFRVKTNYGTIGIRGCELGFQLTADLEEVFIVDLHHADSVVLSLDRTGESRTVEEGGLAVAMVEGLRTREYAASELEELNRITTPVSQEAGMPPATAGDDGSSADDEAMDRANEIAEDASLAENLQGLSMPQAPEAAEVPAGPDRIVGPRNTLASGGGVDWSWGVWEQDVTDIVNGKPQTLKQIGSYSSGSDLSATDFQTLAAGPVLYNLSGSGSAGAMVAKGGQAAVMNGTAGFDVRVGMGVAPVFDGVVDVAGGGNALNFDFSGTIQDGRLDGASVGSYSLNAFGASYGSPDGQRIDGALVGPGQGAKPITGARVQFGFDHPDGVSVRGAGGADLD